MRQLLHQSRRGGCALVVPNRESPHQSTLDSRPDVRQSGAVGRRCLEEPAGAHRILGRPAAGHVADQHLIHHDRQAVDVGALVELGQAGRLFRTHIARRAHGESGARQIRAPGRAHGFRNAEVRHDGMALQEEDVFGLDVAVQDAHPVRVGQCVGDGLRDRQRLLLRERSARRSLELLAQRAAIDVRHDVVEEPAGFA